MLEKMFKLCKEDFIEFINYMSDAVFVMNVEEGPSFRYVALNSVGLQLAGLEKNVIGMQMKDVLPDEINTFLTQKYSAVLEKKSSVRFEHRTQDNRIEESILNPILDHQGNITHILSVTRDITKEKKLLQALKESEERYRRLVEDSPDPIFIHHEGFIEYANNAAVRLVEVGDPGQLIGTSIYDFSPVMYRPIVSERNRHIMEEDDQVISQVEEEIVTVNGKKIHVEVSAMSTIYKGKKVIHSVVRDISERKKLEAALLESEERYRLIAENTTDLIEMLDVEGVIFYASPSHDKILGQPPEHYVSRSLSDFVHPEEIPVFQNSLKKVINNKEVISLELRLPHMNGEWIWTSFDMIPILDEEEHVEKVLIVGEDVTESKKYEQKIYRMAFHDSLTGLPNRQLFSDRVHQAVVRAKRNQSQFAVMYLDCDHFKSINDELGHDAGDEFLKSLGARLRDSIRESDTVARIGGDEFNILLPDIEDDLEVNKVAERILHTVSLPWEYDGKSFTISMSIGIASYPKHGHDVDTIIKKADQALYMAKESGRNRLRWYSDDAN